MNFLQNLLYPLNEMHKEGNDTRAIVVIIGTLVIFAFMVWISIIDIKKKSVTFWKMILASSMTIIVPFVASFFCGCWKLKLFIISSLILWILFLAMNIKFNKDKYIGKADVDLLSAIFSESIAVSLWMMLTIEEYAWLQVTKLWYMIFLYMLVGALIFIVVVLIHSIIKSIITGKNMLSIIVHEKLSVIPMFILVAVMIPYNIMVL